MQDPIELTNIGKYGVIADTKSHRIPPEAWTDANNVVFDDNGIGPAGGHAPIFGDLSVTSEFIMNVPGLGASYWIYASTEKAYVYEGGVHTNITRQTASTDVDYTLGAGDGRLWQGTIFGGIPIINNGVDLPQYWPDLNVAVKLANLDNFEGPGSVPLRAKIIRAFGSYLIALNVVEDGTPLPHSVYWSHKADPGAIPTSWDYTDPTVDAGRTHLTDVHGGEIFDAGLLGNVLIIYKEASTHVLRFSGGNDIFSTDLLLATSGLFAPRCFCAFDNGTKHFVVTSDDIITHAGTKQIQNIAEDRVRNKIFSEIDPTYYLNSFVFENRLTKECWFCYPTIGSEYPTRAARWKYLKNTWTFRDFDGVSTDFGAVTDASADAWDDDNEVWDSDDEPWSIESRVQQIFVNRFDAFKLDVGYLFNGVAPACYVERIGLAIDGKDRDGELRASLSSRKLLSRVWPKITGGTAVVRMQAGKQELLEGPVTWDSPQLFDPATQRFLDSSNEPVNGLLIAIRYEVESGGAWKIEGHDLYITRVSKL